MKPSWCIKELLFILIIFNGSMEFGYILVYPSPAIESMKSNGFSISSFEEKAFKSISALTAIIGPFLSNFLLHYLGRRPVASLFGILGAIFWIMLPFMKRSFFYYGIIERGLIGITMGGYSAICPLYMVELAPPNVKGFFGTFNQVGIAFGIVVCYLIGNWANWINLAYCGSIFSGLLGLLIWICPETKAGLQLQRQRFAKKKNLDNGALLDSVPISETPIKESIFQKKYLKDLLICCMLMFFQQFCGINGILTNITVLFKNAGISISEGIASTISSSAQVFSAFLGGLFIDHIGCRMSLLISIFGLVVSLLFYALSIKYNLGAWSPIIALFLYLLLFGLGMGPIPWFIVPESFPTSVRSIATSIASATNWTCAFLVIFIFPFLQDKFGEFKTMLIFMCIMILGFLFTFCFLRNPKKEQVREQTNDLSINETD